MQSSLKVRTVHIESLGQDLQIREMNAKTQIQLIEARREFKGERPTTAENLRLGAITAAGCVVEWSGETPDAVLESHPMDVILEVAAACMDPRGDGGKNSESAPSDDSSSD